MSRPPILIKDLQKGNHVWKMSVRVVDLWTVTERSGQLHLEMVIQDAMGDQIHVITRHREYKIWMEKITEHHTYTIYNGQPINNDSPPKVCENNLKLLFNSATTVAPTELPAIPTHSFKFKTISDILNRKFSPDCVYDVIGCLHEVYRTQKPGPRKKGCANIALSDASGNIIDCTLWDVYACQLMNFVRPDNAVGPNIVIITHALCKPNTGGNPTLSNAWNGSKLHINLDHPQVEDFRSKLGDYQPSHTPSQSLSQKSYSQLPQQNRYWTIVSEFKSIAEILQLQQDCYCTTYGKTKTFKPSKYGWYYESCSECSAINKNPGIPFQCSCAANDVVGVTKYKIEIDVEYNNSFGVFVFWDKECVPIIGKTAAELRAIMKEANEDHPLIYPTNLDALLNKDFAFRVKYQLLYKQCSIILLNDDENVMNRIKEFFNPDEQTSQHAEKVHSTPVPLDQNNKIMFLCSRLSQSTDATVSMQPSLSNHQNWSPECSSTNTPAKRDAPTIDLDDLPATGFITPKQSATKTKQIKIE